MKRDLKHGVFLDLETVDNGDLDRSRLAATLDHWRWHDFSDAAEIGERIADVDVVATNKCVLDQAILEKAAHLRLIALTATGTNNVDLKTAARLGIAVCNIRDYASDSLAQHAITLMLNLLTQQPWYWQAVRQGAWSSARQFCISDRPIRQARGLNFGVIGYGVLGRATGNLAAALGMNVLIAERKGAEPRHGRLPFEDVIARADVLSLHCPLSPETRGLIDAEVLRQMKRDAILINTSRGALMDEPAVAQALREGIIAGAGIDTLSQEPPPADHPLLASDIPNLIVTPHNAWASRTARQAALDQLAQVVEAFAAGGEMNRV